MGDAVSQKILKDAAFYLGITISNLIKILEPKMVLIASCEPLKGTTYWNIMEETIKKYHINEMETKLELREAQLLEDDYALGACCYVFEYLFETPRLSLAIL